MSKEPTEQEIIDGHSRLQPLPDEGGYSPVPISEILGVNIHSGAHIDTAIDLGFKHFRIDMLWSICNPEDGEWDYAWADVMMNKIRDAGGTALLVLYATPGWLDLSWPRIPGWSGPPAIAIMRDPYVPILQEHLQRVFDRWPWAEANIATETTLTETWQDPDHPGQRGSVDSYIDLVLAPAAEVLKPRGVKIVAPGMTMRGERSSTWNDAMGQLLRFVDRCESMIDCLDVHIYRDTGTQIVMDLIKVLTHGYYSGISSQLGGWWTHWQLYCSETGLVGDDQQQWLNWRSILNALDQEHSANEPLLRAYERVYCYDLWGGPASILHPDGTPRPAALEMAKRLKD